MGATSYITWGCITHIGGGVLIIIKHWTEHGGGMCGDSWIK